MSNLLEIKMFTYAFYCTTAKNTTYDDVRWFIVASSKLYTVIFFIYSALSYFMCTFHEYHNKKKLVGSYVICSETPLKYDVTQFLIFFSSSESPL